MTAILSHPFRLSANGTVATVAQGTDQANAEQIGVLCSTIQGERPIVPTFGVPDPAFSGIAAGVITAQIARWGPNVTVKSVTANPVSDIETDVTVSFA